MLFSVRKPRKKLAYSKRANGLTSHQQVECKKIKKILQILSIKKRILIKLLQTLQARNDDDELEELERKESEMKRLDIAIKFYTVKYLRIMYWFDDEEYIEQIRRRKDLSHFSRMDCPIFFGFRKQDLERIMVALRIPDFVYMPDGSVLKGVEVFLRGLYELRTGENQHRISRNVFGFGDQPLQSRAFSWFIDYVYNNFHHLVHDNLEWFFRNGLIEQSAEAIKNKMHDLGTKYETVISSFLIYFRI